MAGAMAGGRSANGWAELRLAVGSGCVSSVFGGMLMSLAGYMVIAGAGGALVGVVFTVLWARARLAALTSSLEAERSAREALDENKGAWRRRCRGRPRRWRGRRLRSRA